MSKREQHLGPEYRKLNRVKIMGERTRHTVTFSPNSANPGEQLYIRAPRLSRGDCLVPESLNSCFDLTVSNTRNHHKNHLSKLLQSRLEIKYAGEVIYDNSNESVGRPLRINGYLCLKEPT